VGSSGDRTIIARAVLHRGAKFDLEQVTVSGTGGMPIRRDVVRHPGAVVILPLLETPDGPRVVLIRNDRIALGKSIHELPAGTLEPMERPEDCAPRELAEETGYEAATITPLGRFYTTPGLTDEVMWSFVATGLRSVGQRLEPDEHLTVEPVRVPRAFEMIDTGELMDAKSMLTLLLAERRGVLRRT
jgi:ADP-ribose pyrophosphatase